MSSSPSTSPLPLTAAEPSPPHRREAARARPAAPIQERRRHERATVRLLVQVVTADRVATYMAENLSAGGALLLDGPALPAGTELSLALKLRGDTWHVRARVLRVERDHGGHPALAVAFPGIVPRVQDLIQSHVLGCLRKRARSVT